MYFVLFRSVLFVSLMKEGLLADRFVCFYISVNFFRDGRRKIPTGQNQSAELVRLFFSDMNLYLEFHPPLGNWPYSEYYRTNPHFKL